MRILIIHPFFLERGGAERKILLLAKHLSSIGCTVKLICFEKNFKESFDELSHGLDIVVVKKLSLRRLFRFLKASEFDLGIASNYPAHFFLPFLKFFKKIKKTIWICNEVHSAMHEKIKLKHRIIIPFEKLLVKHLDLIVSNSENTSNNILKHFKLRSVIVYPGVIDKKFA